MSSHISDVVAAWGLAVAEDAAIAAYCQANGLDPVTVYEGYDDENRPPASTYPAVIIFPAPATGGPEARMAERGLGVQVLMALGRSETEGRRVRYPNLFHVENLAELVADAVGRSAHPPSFNKSGTSYESKIIIKTIYFVRARAATINQEGYRL